MKRMFRVFVANIKADLWCLSHFGDCVLIRQDKYVGRLFAVTTRIEVGSGSIFKGTWKTKKVFYEEDVK